MKKTILTTVSVIALMGALPALAETTKSQAEINAEASTTGNIVDDAKVVIKDIKDGTVETYDNIKATLIGKESVDDNISVIIDTRKTANGIIGHPVYNEKHENIAKVTDIILDKDGKASIIVVSDGMFGMGKKTAFDYNAITRVETDGDVIMPLNEEIIKNATAFSYRKADKSDDKMKVIPYNGYSVSQLLRGRLLNQSKESVADIENISFKNSTANQLIVGFDKTLGFGGEKAVLSYTDATIVRHGNALDFQLSTEQAAQFEAYKKSLAN
ncbi:MAG: PRC-barrel domain-containing protein [Rhodospirillales bacterium]|nr:PRC-barrel domain-containing protein [Rhodospirillales bacterium]